MRTPTLCDRATRTPIRNVGSLINKTIDELEVESLMTPTSPFSEITVIFF